MPPGALELDRFALETHRGRATSQVATPQLVLGDYGDVRIVATEGRLQVDFTAEASDQDASSVASWVLEEVHAFRPSGVGFNAVVRIEGDDAHPNPIAPLTRPELASERLGTDQLRLGVKLLYADETARVTLSIDPDVNDENAWAASVNRHFESVPDGDERSTILRWFASASQDFERSLRELLAEPGHEQHAA